MRTRFRNELRGERGITYAISAAPRRDEKGASIDALTSMRVRSECLRRRDGYTTHGAKERERERAASTSATMTGHVLKDDHATCIGTEMKLVLMNRARLVKYMRRVDTDGVT